MVNWDFISLFPVLGSSVSTDLAIKNYTLHLTLLKEILMLSSTKKNSLYAGAAILMATVLAYGNIIHNGFVSYDDVSYLIENDHVRPGLTKDGFLWSLTATYDGNWFPLTWLSHMTDMSLFGADPRGHHLISLGIHIINALLLMWILARSTGLVWRSAIVAALFALHPQHVESVAWAAERKDVLSTLLFMLTISVYLGYAARRTTLRYLSVVLLYACGLAAKPMLVSLPCVLLLFDFWPLHRWRPGVKYGTGSSVQSLPALVFEKIPFALLAAASGIITIIVQRSGGAMNDPGIDSPAANAAHAAVNYLRYLYKAAWPTDLAVLYPYQDSVPAWQVLGAVTLLLCLTLLAIGQWRDRPYYAVGWLWFLITMAPVSGFVRVGVHSIADRYTYIPMTGLFILAVWATAEFLGRHGTWGRPASSALFALFSILGVATWKQTAHWKDSTTLFEQAVRVTSDNWVAHNNLASEMIKKGEYRQALWHTQQAVRINPFYTYAYVNMGGALSGLGDIRGAIDAYKEALHRKPQPRFVAEVYYKLGLAYSYAGDMKRAFETCGILQQIDPDMADVLRRNLFIAGNMHSTAPPCGSGTHTLSK